MLVNPGNAATIGTTVRDVEAGARAIGLQIQVLKASTSREIDAAFATLVRERPDALFVGADPFFSPGAYKSPRWRRVMRFPRHIIARLCRNRRPDELRNQRADTYRQVGVYTGRILKGAKPADLPVVQSSKFELVIKPRPPGCSASTVPPMLLGLADEVIE